MKYRLKPIEVDAVQWWPPGDERHDPVAIKMGCMDAKPIRDTWWCWDSVGTWVELRAGDWITKTTGGRVHRVRQEEFEDIYEQVD